MVGTYYMSLIHTLYQAGVLSNTVIHSWLNVLSSTASLSLQRSGCVLGGRWLGPSPQPVSLGLLSPPSSSRHGGGPHPFPHGLEGPLVLRGLEQSLGCTITHPG